MKTARRRTITRYTLSKGIVGTMLCWNSGSISLCSYVGMLECYIMGVCLYVLMLVCWNVDSGRTGLAEVATAESEREDSAQAKRSRGGGSVEVGKAFHHWLILGTILMNR